MKGPSDDEGIEQRPRRQAELGRLLVAAAGYRILASDGRQIGALVRRRALFASAPSRH